MKIKLLFVFILILFHSSCKDDYLENEPSPGDLALLENAKSYYELNKSKAPALRSGDLGIPYMPAWDYTYYLDNDEFDVVELDLMTKGRISIMDKETNEIYNKTKDQKYKKSYSRYVFLRNKKNDESIGFIMTIIPSLKYIESSNFEVFDNFYLERDNQFDGFVYYYTLDGDFINGWVYEDGNVTKTVTLVNKEDVEEDAPITRAVTCDMLVTIDITETCYYSYGVAGGKKSGTTFLGCNYEMTHLSYNMVCQYSGGGNGGLVGSGNGSGAGSNGNNSNSNNAKESADPCANMDGKVKNTAFSNKLNDMSGLTSKNYEAGVSYTYKDGTYTFSNRDGNAGDPSIGYKPTSSSPIDGFVHTHYNGLLNTFSPGDIASIYDWYNRDGIKDISNFSMGLVTKDGVAFLMVSDPAKFKALHAKGLETVKNTMDYGYLTYQINPQMGWDASNNMLAQMLKSTQSGLTLMTKKKSDAAFSKKEVDANNKVNNTNCK